MEKVEALEDMVSLAPSSLVKVSYKCWLICFYSYDCEWKQLAENQQCYSGPVWELESDRGAGVRLQDQKINIRGFVCIYIVDCTPSIPNYKSSWLF